MSWITSIVIVAVGGIFAVRISSTETSTDNQNISSTLTSTISLAFSSLTNKSGIFFEPNSTESENKTAVLASESKSVISSRNEATTVADFQTWSQLNENSTEDQTEESGELFKNLSKSYLESEKETKVPIETTEDSENSSLSLENVTNEAVEDTSLSMENTSLTQNETESWKSETAFGFSITEKSAVPLFTKPSSQTTTEVPNPITENKKIAENLPHSTVKRSVPLTEVSHASFETDQNVTSVFEEALSTDSQFPKIPTSVSEISSITTLNYETLHHSDKIHVTVSSVARDSVHTTPVAGLSESTQGLRLSSSRIEVSTTESASPYSKPEHTDKLQTDGLSKQQNEYLQLLLASTSRPKSIQFAEHIVNTPSSVQFEHPELATDNSVDPNSSKNLMLSDGLADEMSLTRNSAKQTREQNSASKPQTVKTSVSVPSAHDVEGTTGSTKLHEKDPDMGAENTTSTLAAAPDMKSEGSMKQEIRISIMDNSSLTSNASGKSSSDIGNVLSSEQNVGISPTVQESKRYESNHSDATSLTVYTSEILNITELETNLINEQNTLSKENCSDALVQKLLPARDSIEINSKKNFNASNKVSEVTTSDSAIQHKSSLTALQDIPRFTDVLPTAPFVKDLVTTLTEQKEGNSTNHGEHLDSLNESLTQSSVIGGNKIGVQKNQSDISKGSKEISSIPAIYDTLIATNGTISVMETNVSTVTNNNTGYSTAISRNTTLADLETFNYTSNVSVVGFGSKGMGSTSPEIKEQILLKPQNENISDSQTTAERVESTTVVTTLATTKQSFRIRKPKIRVIGDEAVTTRSIMARATTTKRPRTTSVGPPVSIFRKDRTRRPSITSSTTQGTTTKYVYRGAFNPVHIAGTEAFNLSLLPQTTTTTVSRTTEAVEEEKEEEEEELEETTTTLNSISQEQVQDQTALIGDEIVLIKMNALAVVDKGIRWRTQLNNKQSPEFKKQDRKLGRTLEQIFRSTQIEPVMWKVEIDGFAQTYPGSRSVEVDFNLFLVKTDKLVSGEYLVRVFNERLVNNTFGRYLFNPAFTEFENGGEELLNKPTEAPEVEPPIPQWAIAVIVVGAASFIFIVLFAAVTVYGRHHMRRRYMSKLDEDLERSVDSRDWDNKLGGSSAYENLAADGVYDYEDHISGSTDNIKRKYVPPNPPRNSRMKHYDSWRTEWTEAPKRARIPVAHIIY